MLQQLSVYIILAIAIIFLGIKFFKPKKKGNCGNGCDCK